MVHYHLIWCYFHTTTLLPLKSFPTGNVTAYEQSKRKNAPLRNEIDTSPAIVTTVVEHTTQVSHNSLHYIKIGIVISNILYRIHRRYCGILGAATSDHHDGRHTSPDRIVEYTGGGFYDNQSTSISVSEDIQSSFYEDQSTDRIDWVTYVKCMWGGGISTVANRWNKWIDWSV